MHRCIGFTWQDFGSRGAAGGQLRRKRLGLPCARHRCCQLAPADPLQRTAEPVSQAGGTSVGIYLRKGKMLCSSEREVLLAKGSESAAGCGFAASQG